uniref:EH domain-containing protein 1 n=1 Tax=Lygus hesperus TaxID=30085 RepID=A0A0K8TAP2_LYGHE
MVLSWGTLWLSSPKKQYRPLSKYGNAFLNRFQACMVDSPVLRGITIVDTPGILSGEKQRVDRGYDFTGVLEWFAERVDRIILMFDAHKLDISDEFRRAIEAFRGHDDKIRIVLNKADMVDHQQLMRVYGALMWALGKVLQTPEVARVYIGSFWDRPHPHELNSRLFEDEEQDLFRDLQSLPRNATLRKLNDLIKRARLAKVHAYIISSLRKDMPSMFGKDGKKKELIKGLSTIYEQIQREHQISPGDFPDIKKMQECLANHDFTKFNPLKPRLLEVVDKMLAEDISRLMAQIPHEDVIQAPSNLHGGAFDGVEDQSPFGYKKGEGIDAGHGEPEWIVNKLKYDYDAKFEALGPINGKVSGEAAKSEMVKSKLPKPVLGKIWKLADIDKDGFLDNDEFALAMHLIKVKLDGHDLPPNLPDHLIPPSKRQSTLSAFTVRKPPMTPVNQPTPVEVPRTPLKKRVPIPPVKMDSTLIDDGFSRNKESLTKIENGLREDEGSSISVENGLPQEEQSSTQVNHDEVTEVHFKLMIVCRKMK